MNKKMRLERLNKLKELMVDHDKIFPKSNFNLEVWISTDKHGNSIDDLSKLENSKINEKTCGFAACALGSAAVHSWFKKRGLKIDRNLQVPDYKDYYGFDAGAAFFGIDFYESKWLFSPEYYRNKQGYSVHVTTDMVAKRIQKLINHYEISNDVWLEEYEDVKEHYTYTVTAA